MSPAQRRDRIASLLRSGTVTTQEELRAALGRERLHVTQATISRDLRALRCVRVIRDDGRVVYELPPASDPADAAALPAGLRAMVQRVTRNEALVVVHTAPGAASAVARAIDLLRVEGALGSLAGDDTVFVAPESTRRTGQLERRLAALLNDNQGKRPGRRAS